MIEKLEQYNNLLEVCLILEFFAISLWSILHGCNLTSDAFWPMLLLQLSNNFFYLRAGNIPEFWHLSLTVCCMVVYCCLILFQFSWFTLS